MRTLDLPKFFAIVAIILLAMFINYKIATRAAELDPVPSLKGSWYDPPETASSVTSAKSR